MLLEHVDPNDIQGLEGARQATIHIPNLVKELASENRGLRKENQRLPDENSRLEGKHGRAHIKASKKPGTTSASDHPSEQARRLRKKRSRRVPRSSAFGWIESTSLCLTERSFRLMPSSRVMYRS